MNFVHWPDECTRKDDCVCGQIDAQLAAIHATGKWAKFRESTVVCSACGGPLAEVMATSPESVVVTRAPVPASEHPMAAGLHWAEVVSTVYDRRVRASRSDKWWVRVSADCEFDLLCRCRVEIMPVPQVMALVAGSRKAVL